MDVGLELGEGRIYPGITLELSGDLGGRNTYANLRMEDGFRLGLIVPVLNSSDGRIKINVVVGSVYGVGDDVPITPGTRGGSAGLVGNAEALVDYAKALRSAKKTWLADAENAASLKDLSAADKAQAMLAATAGVEEALPVFTDKEWEGAKVFFRCSEKVAGGGGGVEK